MWYANVSATELLEHCSGNGAREARPVEACRKSSAGRWYAEFVLRSLEPIHWNVLALNAALATTTTSDVGPLDLRVLLVLDCEHGDNFAHCTAVFLL